MNTTLQHLAIRPFMGLLAAFVLASSATVAVAAETHAAKALPNLQVGEAGCDVDLIGGIPVTTSEATFEMDDAGKGKWVHVSTWIVVDGGEPSLTGWNANKAERSMDTVIDPIASGDPLKADARVQWQAALVNRKGAELSARVKSNEATCSLQ